MRHVPGTLSPIADIPEDGDPGKITAFVEDFSVSCCRISSAFANGVDVAGFYFHYSLYRKKAFWIQPSFFGVGDLQHPESTFTYTHPPHLPLYLTVISTIRGIHMDEKTVFAEKVAEYILDEVEDSRTLEEATERVRRVVSRFKMKSNIEIAEMIERM